MLDLIDKFLPGDVSVVVIGVYLSLLAAILITALFLFGPNAPRTPKTR